MFTNLLGGGSTAYVPGTEMTTCTLSEWKILDPDSDFTNNPPDCDRWYVETMQEKKEAYIERDMGISYFGTTFEIEWTALKGGGGDKAKNILCGVSNSEMGTFRAMDIANVGVIVYYAVNLAQTYSGVKDFSNNDTDLWYRGSYAVAQMWFNFTRSGATYTLKTYDDAGRTNLIGTQVITGHPTYTYRYFHVTGSGNYTTETDGYTGWGGEFNIISH